MFICLIISSIYEELLASEKDFEQLHCSVSFLYIQYFLQTIFAFASDDVNENDAFR